MVECRWLPSSLSVASGTIFTGLRMQRRLRRPVAGGALATHVGSQQRVGETLLRRLHQLRAAMVGMTGHAIRCGQRLMKGDRPAIPFNGRAGRGADADVGHLVTGRAARRRHAFEGRMASEAVGRDAGMRRDQRPGRNHQVRQGKAERDQRAQVYDDQPETPAAHHFHPQNRQIAMMCVNASTPNASVIGKWTTRHALTTSNVRLSQ